MALAVYGFITPQRKIERAGISYEYLVIKDKLALGLPTHPVLKHHEKHSSRGESSEPGGEELTEWMDPEDAKYNKFIARLDPNDAKEQDHYKVLGLSKLRYQATQAQIRTAYRHKVLIYHPDKGKASSGELRNESVFACIQKAYEQLGVSEEKRRAFDSIDPEFDESIPDSIGSAAEFFNVLGPVFERNARFSINQPVPLLGDQNSDRSHVEHFYEFWFDWKSWREFSYLDSEDKSRGEDRWERREIEKQNKAEREKRRKRDLKRISTLVELAYSKDERVEKFKEEDKQKKKAAKEEKQREKQRRELAEQEEQKRRDEEMENERRRQEEEEREATKAKQQKKKVLAAQRKRLRDLASQQNYWLGGKIDGQENQQRMMRIMEQIERVCLSAEFEELSACCEQMIALNPDQSYEDALKILRECSRKDGPEAINGDGSRGTATANIEKTRIWAPAELQLLVKAVNLFPPGTQERWKQVAEYVSYHSGKERTDKDIIRQVRSLKSDPSSNSQPAAMMKSAAKSVGPEETKTNTSAVQSSNAAESGEEEWSAEQQKQLEKALKETSAGDPERWETIASKVDGKNKKQCIRRYKRLAEMIKQSKSQMNST